MDEQAETAIHPNCRDADETLRHVCRERPGELEGALNKCDSLLDQIPDKLSEVMMPMKQDILTVFEPGYRSLNWLSSNLDAYIDDAFEKT